MTVTQYIGARYVPVFADPAEWNNTRTYEPLTIVMHEGNSYTSKQYVPVGIDISNESFWAETGNYNAQVEAYRQEVLTFDNRITSVESALDLKENKTVSYVGNYGAVEGSADNNWAEILSAIAAVSDTVYFGNGTWDVGEGIDIPSEIKNIYGSGATIYTSKTPNYMVSIAAETHISGLTFNPNGRAEKCITSESATAGNRIYVTNCNFNEIGHDNYAIYNGFIGLYCVGCAFINRTNLGGIAIQTHTDNVISSCKFFNFDVFIKALGVNVTNCYFWRNSECLGIVLAPEAFTNLGSNAAEIYDAIFTNCEFDCIGYLVINPRNVIINNNQFYWNDRDINSDCYLFYACGSRTDFQAIQFNSNVIKFQAISYHVWQFGLWQETQHIGNNALVNKYTSKDNVFSNNVYSMTSISNYHLICGWCYDNNVSSGSSKYLFKLERAAYNTRAFNSNRICGKLNENYMEFNWNLQILQMLIKNFTSRTGIQQYVNAYWDETNQAVYFPFEAFAVREIDIMYMPVPVATIYYGAVSNLPDFTGMTEIKPYVVSATQVS